MKILLISGHVPGYNKCMETGVNEGDLNIEVIKMLKSLLDPYADVEVYPYERDMTKDIKDGNIQVDLTKYDYVYEQHFNALNGIAHGTEVIVCVDHNEDISLEQEIIRAITSFGFTTYHDDSGIVRSDDLLNMCTCDALGVKYSLVEMCFYDNIEEMNLYRGNKNAIIATIADAIILGLKLKRRSKSAETPDSVKKYYVGTGWVNGTCQNRCGTYKKVQSAIYGAETAVLCANRKKIYYVFDKPGKVVYSAIPKTIE